MDGFRIDTTGEVDLELSGDEAKAMKTAIVYTLFQMMASVHHDNSTMASLVHLNDALEKLGVKV